MGRGRTGCSTSAFDLSRWGGGADDGCRATKLIAQVKEREKVAELAKAEEKEFEESDDEGVEIEGLERVEDARGNAEVEEEGSGEEEEEEEAPRPVRRRPIIEIQ